MEHYSTRTVADICILRVGTQFLLPSVSGYAILIEIFWRILYWAIV